MLSKSLPPSLTHLTVPAVVSDPGPLQERTLGNPWDMARKLSSLTGTNRIVGTDSRSPTIARWHYDLVKKLWERDLMTTFEFLTDSWPSLTF